MSKKLGITLIAVGFVTICACGGIYYAGTHGLFPLKAADIAAVDDVWNQSGQLVSGDTNADPEQTSEETQVATPAEETEPEEEYVVEYVEVDPFSASAKYNQNFKRTFNRMITVVLADGSTPEQLQEMISETEATVDDRNADIGIYYVIFAEEQKDAYLDELTANIQLMESVIDAYREPYVLEGQDLRMEIRVKKE